MHALRYFANRTGTANIRAHSLMAIVFLIWQVVIWFDVFLLQEEDGMHAEIGRVARAMDGDIYLLVARQLS